MIGSRLRAVLGLAVTQLRHARVRTGLAVVGVALAVVLVATITGLAVGVDDTGSRALTYIDQDVWVTAGPLTAAPGTVGGIENPLLDAHTVSRDIERVDGVTTAEAIAFRTLYVSPNGSEFITVVGVGITGNGSTLNVDSQFDQGDTHYANGSYDGPRSRAAILDRRTAARLNVSANDTINIGGTVGDARRTEYTVVGTSGTFATFLGTPTVVVHLSELQEFTGTTGTDSAALIAVDVADDAAPRAVRDRIAADHPDLRVRTRRQQFRAVIADQGALLAGTGTLVVLALLAGTGLVANALAMLVYRQRAALATLKATGVRTSSLLLLVGAEGIVVGTLGGLVGLAATPPVVRLLNEVVARATGFPDLARTPPVVFALGLAVAVGMGLVGAVIAGWRVAKLRPLAYLD